MSRIVYQGVQSCSESQLIESTIMKLKVAQGTSTNNKSSIQDFHNNPTHHAWESFNSMQNIPNISSSLIEKQSSYIHPWTKTPPKLSQKSLELCTENLGSETGSDDGTDINILSFNDVVEYSKNQELESGEEEKMVALKLESRINSKANSHNFPPPLTSIRCSNSIQCRTHREDGRLIIEAIEIPSRNTYLQAERSNGRLRLSFLNECDNHFGTKVSNEGELGDIEDYDDDVIDEYGSDEDSCEGGDESYDDVKNDVNMEEIIGNNNIEVEGKIGIEKLQRLSSRCIEGGHGNGNLCNWRSSLWVATS